jgi:hypothetical protein
MLAAIVVSSGPAGLAAASLAGPVPADATVAS